MWCFLIDIIVGIRMEHLKQLLKKTEFIEKYGITFITGVPSTLDMLANRQEKHQKNLSSLKGIITMSSPLEKAA